MECRWTGGRRQWREETATNLSIGQSSEALLCLSDHLYGAHTSHIDTHWGHQYSPP